MPALLGGGKGYQAKTVRAFESALQKALHERGTYSVIEVWIDKLDFSNAAKRFSAVVHKRVAKNN